ncbi:MAG: hypothetical protein KatS3mg076_0131 [Candidatus Binatia bacterium]|nr:MAG: hypothetical protein KatS3mg076_0131 [Candidatus Binatia bacterium]
MANPARYLVAANLLLLGFSAYWAAVTVNTVVAARLRPPPRVELRPPPPAAEPAANRPRQAYAVIHERDIFNSAKPAPPPPPPPPVRTQLQLRLWGVAIHHGSEPSYAIIEDLRQRKQDLYRVGDTVPGDAKLVKIEWDKVTLERDGKKEYLEISAEQLASLGPAARRPFPARGRGRGRRGPARAPGIERVGEDEFVIERAEVDAALENMNQLFTQIRAVPHFEQGQTTGFRVFAIRSGSIFDRIGLRNGDIVRSINNVQVTDPARALSLLQELRNERTITVELTRNRQPLTLTYEIR